MTYLITLQNQLQMKSLHFTLFILLLTCQLSAQVTDNTINVEIQTKSLYSNISVFNDPVPFDLEDIVMKAHVWTSLTGFESSACFEFESDGVKHLNDHHQPLYAANGILYFTYFDFYLEGWESDSSPACTFNGADTEFEGKWATDHFLINNQMTSLRPANVWSTDWSNQANELLYNDPDYDMAVRSVWRFNKGENHLFPLDFGTIGVGQSKTHYNTNKPAPSGVSSSDNMGYKHDAFQSSPDVYYQFTLAEDANVILRTTGFDTYLTLLNLDHQVMEDDDDGGPGYGSEIETKLCPGTYWIVAEGYQDNTGYFTLDISVTSGISSVSPGALNYTYAQCPGETGSVVANPTGGVPPYVFGWPNGEPDTSSPQASGIPIGINFASITDFCGNSEIFSVSMSAEEDVDAPNMVCGSETYYLSPNETIVVNPVDIDAGSTDNCEINTLTLSQTNFSYDNPGEHSVTLTAEDYSGNISSCNTTITIIQNNATAVHNLKEPFSFTLAPNPTSDWFSVKIDPAELNADTKMSIVTLTGQIVRESIVTDHNQRVDISGLAQGIYLVRLNDSEKAGVRKLMVK